MKPFSFNEILKEWSAERILELYSKITEEDILTALNKENLFIKDLIALLSPSAQPHLEKIAQKAHKITRQHFGRTISIYAPLYLSNHCTSDCIYCFFSPRSGIKEKRVTLTFNEIEEECKSLSSKGIQTVLLLTGDAPKIANLEYLAKATHLAKKYFHSVSLEVYAMEESGYATLVEHGAEGITLYMETYDKETYDKVHLFGKKKDYFFRLHALERAGRAGVRKLTCGVLLGLSDWHCDVIWLALHAKYLQKVCWQSTIALSFPRLKHTPPRFQLPNPVSLNELVQIIVAMRLFLPYSPFNLSTREPAEVRDHLIPLGITSMSAGSSTRPGGYSVYKTSSDEGEKPVLMQFEIDDTRTVDEVVEAIKRRNYDPVWVDFDPGSLIETK